MTAYTKGASEREHFPVAMGGRQGHIAWKRSHANYQEGMINGREATADDLEVRERAYRRQAEQVAELVRVAPRSSNG